MKLLSTRALAVVTLLSGVGSAQTTSLVSRNSSGVQADNASSTPTTRSISADGRFVVFTSLGENLGGSDSYFTYDVFVHDRQAGTTEMVSQSSAGVHANGYSSYGSISADGRFVAFVSEANNLVVNDTNGVDDVFLRDLQFGTTRRISLGSSEEQGNGVSSNPSVSADGRYVAFLSFATNLAPDDVNGVPDMYVRDRQDDTTTLVSRNSLGILADGPTGSGVISNDGRFVAFSSGAANLVPDDVNGFDDVFVHDRLTGATEIASLGVSGSQGNGPSRAPSISADGRVVAFMSDATNLVLADSNDDADIFTRDLVLESTQLISATPLGGSGNAPSFFPSISADGTQVAFYTWSADLVPNDAHNGYDVFVRTRPHGPTELVSLAWNGDAGEAESETPSISGDGRFVVFSSRAWNLIPNDVNVNVRDVFVRDRAPSIASFCAGDGSEAACPCGNSGAAGKGCQSSASTGGALLTVSGAADLSHDTLVFTSTGELPSSLSIVLQGTLSIAPANYGDGLRCVGGTLKRLYVKSAVGGVVTAPQGSDPSVSARSAALGSVIPAGASRYYQTYYRDPNASFCPSPPGNTWNVSSGVSAVWGY